MQHRCPRLFTLESIGSIKMSACVFSLKGAAALSLSHYLTFDLCLDSHTYQLSPSVMSAFTLSGCELCQFETAVYRIFKYFVHVHAFICSSLNYYNPSLSWFCDCDKTKPKKKVFKAKTKWYY